LTTEPRTRFSYAISSIIQATLTALIEEQDYSHTNLRRGVRLYLRAP
jgi:hypothetical protein